MTNILTGDAFVYANNDPATIVVIVHHRTQQVIQLEPIRDHTWHDYVENVARPALTAAGWNLDAWHRPRTFDDILATAVTWKDL